MLWRCLRAALIALAASLAVALPARAEDALTILFHIRPPYSEFDAAMQVHGLLITPVVSAADQADIALTWIEMPPARQTEEIKRATKPVCGLGWFERPDRREFARFSGPIYLDRTTVIVARKDDTRFTDPSALRDVFRDTSRTLVLKNAYSYGATIDGWIKELQPHTASSSEANEALLNMIALRHGDYLIMAPEEAEYLLRAVPALAQSLRIVALSDAPRGEYRFLMCSMATPALTIERLNRWLP